jgi:protein-tyrosine phosphatase
MTAIPRFRRLARAAKHTPDRLLHPRRRRRALRRVGTARPDSLLVMCLGNICRSPFAGGVLERLLPEREVRSAGFLESGRPAPREAVSVGALHGVNLSGHRSTQITPEALARADLVIVMDGRQAARIAAMAPAGTLVERLGDFDPGPIETRTVVDPVDRDLAFFERVYERIDACCDSLARGIEAGAREGV